MPCPKRAWPGGAPHVTLAGRIQSQMHRLHPLGRDGTPGEVASVIAALKSDDFGFVSGAVIPLDGGRAAQGLDPEETG
jgi:NAD(P)-dependent dehydrogenase (short-subunit alcohol dehydrogenase family)